MSTRPLDTSVVVTIADAYGDAVVVPIAEVQEGDYVFDIAGRRHQVMRVTDLRHERKITRVDRVKSWHEHGSTITIVRGER